MKARSAFYDITKAIEKIVSRKKSAEKQVNSELEWLDRFLEENGEKEIYGSTYNKVYRNYRKMLAEE